MKKSTAWREDRVEMFGTWVSQTGAKVYELLSQGKTMREVSDLTGVAMGSMSGYMERAKKYGVIGERKKMDVIATDAEGNEYRFTSEKQIKANLYSYSSVRRACLEGRVYCGMTWRFGTEHGHRVNWRGHMVTRRTARFYDACMNADMKYGDISRIGAECGMNKHSALAAYRHLYRWGFAKRICPSYKVIGKSERLGIVEFDSIDDAEMAGFNARSIRDCFIGKQKTHAGYTWEKITDAEDRQKARGKAAIARQGVRNNDCPTVQQGDAEHMWD